MRAGLKLFGVFHEISTNLFDIVEHRWQVGVIFFEFGDEMSDGMTGDFAIKSSDFLPLFFFPLWCLQEDILQFLFELGDIFPHGFLSFLRPLPEGVGIDYFAV